MPDRYLCDCEPLYLTRGFEAMATSPKKGRLRKLFRGLFWLRWIMISRTWGKYKEFCMTAPITM
jgi:hypothetical protein